jgi:hypothetical protein
MFKETNSPSANITKGPFHDYNNSAKAVAEGVRALIDRDLRLGPLRAATDDPKLLAKTATLRKDNESLNSFISWSGLNYRQISEWRMEKLEPWCKQAERNNENYPEPNAIRDANQKPVV